MAKHFLKGMSSLGYEPKQAFEFTAHAQYNGVDATRAVKQGDFVKITSTGVVQLAASGEYVHGRVDIVYTGAPNSLHGQRLTVDLFAQRAEMAVAGGVVAAGAKLVAAGNGKLRAYDSVGGDTADEVVGFALTAAAADGEEFEVAFRF